MTTAPVNTESESTEGNPTPIPANLLFFDGVCGLCNRFVNFVLRNDRSQRFRLAPLQGETAGQVLSREEREELKSVVLWDGRTFHRKSSAVVRVLWGLGPLYKLPAALLWVIPKPLRDLGYSLVAQFRYAIFGKQPSCRMPTESERGRLLP